MKTWNRLALMGNLASSPELIETKTGKIKVTFPVATNRITLTEKGERVQTADFHRIIAWEKLGELCKEYLSIGDPVYAEGRVHYRSYDDKDGKRRYVTEVMLDEINFLPRNGAAKTAKNGKDQKSAKAMSAKGTKVAA